MNRLLNAAVIGCGYWGPNLIRNLRSVADCEVKSVCDLSEERLRHIKSLYPEIHFTTRCEEVIADAQIDAVMIATPVASHFQLAKQSLEAGKHTFVEKPITASVDQARELTALAEGRGLTLMTGHTFIYSAPVRRIKELIQGGELGEILYISCRRLNLGLVQKDINVAWDLAPHDISIILYVLEKTPLSVNCQGKAHIDPNVEDVTSMTLNFQNGGLAIIHSSWLDPNKVREMTFVGSEKMLVYSDTEPLEKIRIYDKRIEIPAHYDSFGEFCYSYHYGDVCSPYIRQEEPLKVECQHFVDCIRRGAKPDSSGLEGLEVVKILEATATSLRNRGAEVWISGRVPTEPRHEAQNGEVRAGSSVRV